MRGCFRAGGWAFLSLALVLLATGCGKKLVTVHGKVTRNGQPIQVSRTGTVRVTLMPYVEPGQPYTTLPTDCDKQTGEFTVQNVPVGKYRIGVEVLDPNPTQDALKGAFAPQSSPIVREIDGKTPLDIDLAHPNG